MTNNNYSSSISRGLGGMFIFAALQLLENDDYLLTLIVLGLGVANLLPIFWQKKWTSLIVLGVNTGFSAILFYKFLMLETRYIQWLWILMLIYYVVRLRKLGNDQKVIQEILPMTPEQGEPQELENQENQENQKV